MNKITVKALKGFDTSVNGTGDGGAFGISTVITTTLSNGRILGCAASFPSKGGHVLCVSARRDRGRYVVMVRHVVGLTRLPAGRSYSHFCFLTLHGFGPGRYLTVVSSTVDRVRKLNFIIVSKVHSLICSVGSPDRTAYMVSGLVR